MNHGPNTLLTLLNQISALKENAKSIISAEIAWQQKKHKLVIECVAIKKYVEPLRYYFKLCGYAPESKECKQLLTLNEAADRLILSKDLTMVIENSLILEQEIQTTILLKESCTDNLYQTVSSKLQHKNTEMEIEPQIEDAILNIFNDAVSQSCSNHIISFFEEMLNNQQFIAFGGELLSKYFIKRNDEKKIGNFNPLRKLVAKLTKSIYEKYEYPCANYEINDLFAWDDIKSKAPMIKAYFLKIPQEVIYFLLPIYRKHILRLKSSDTLDYWKNKFVKNLIIEIFIEATLDKNQRNTIKSVRSKKRELFELLNETGAIQALISEFDTALQSYNPIIQLEGIQKNVYADSCKLAVTKYKLKCFLNQFDIIISTHEIVSNLSASDKSNKKAIKNLLALKAALEEIISLSCRLENLNRVIPEAADLLKSFLLTYDNNNVSEGDNTLISDENDDIGVGVSESQDERFLVSALAKLKINYDPILNSEKNLLLNNQNSSNSSRAHSPRVNLDVNNYCPNFALQKKNEKENESTFTYDHNQAPTQSYQSNSTNKQKSTSNA
ncbi:MAG: hypothetical protein JSS07_05955 [Proteobacteria bacterium]|nr:hypothetical protein [Pseudomonadota bacterium]